MEYPFQPKSIRSIKRGHFWSIPLDDGRFACGIAVEDRGQPDPVSGVLTPRRFMAALLNWVGMKPPTLHDIETISQVVKFGYASYHAISKADGFIHGQRDMDEHPVILYDCVTHRSGGPVFVVNGSKRVRVADKTEAATMPIMSGLGMRVLRIVANNRWGEGQNPTTLPKPPREPEPEPRPSRIRPPMAAPMGPLASRPPTVERDKDGEPDGRALKILDRAFWSGGWKRSVVAPDELSDAINAGLMFEPIDIDHDDAVRWAIEARAAVSPALVASAFIDSLATRRLDLRSALGSYSSTTHLVPHDQNDWICNTCYYFGKSPVDLNVLNFERFKFGGVRHRGPLYAAFDLHQLAQWRQRETPQSLEPLTTILEIWAKLPDDARAGDAAKALTGVIKSNSNERRGIVEVAALAGILPSDADPPTKRLITVAEQEARHPGGKNDWEYPAHTWRGHFGVNPHAILKLL